jgi:DNA-directed RNA polymerase subunit RPC12/RpoP
MAIPFAEKMSFAFTCSNCGAGFERGVAWLMRHNKLPCPSCGFPIDLQSTYYKTIVAELAQAARNLDHRMRYLREKG